VRFESFSRNSIQQIHDVEKLIVTCSARSRRSSSNTVIRIEEAEEKQQEDKRLIDQLAAGLEKNIMFVILFSSLSLLASSFCLCGSDTDRRE
jgi:hypothetical protein